MCLIISFCCSGETFCLGEPIYLQPSATANINAAKMIATAAGALIVRFIALTPFRNIEKVTVSLPGCNLLDTSSPGRFTDKLAGSP